MTNELANLYRYRQLIAALTSRDLKARYRGSVLGYFWSLANPLLLLGVYTFVFTVFLPRPQVTPAGMDVPYPLFLFAGILPWTFFAGAVMEATGAVSSNAGLIKKVLFPAEALPMVVVLSHLVHFILALPILIAALLLFFIMGKAPLDLSVLLFPIPMILEGFFVAGIALIVSSASVLFRDLRDLIANLLQLGFFLTPIIYSVDQVPAPLRALLRLNPLTPFVAAFQDIFVFAKAPSLLDLTLMILFATASMAMGLFVFNRLRDTLAEAL